MQATREDLREMKEDMVDRLDQQTATLASIDGHLRTLNGRVGGVETVSATHRVRLENIEREVFSASKRPVATLPLGEPKIVTWRDVWIFAAAVGATVAFVEWLIPFVRGLAQ